VMALGRCLGARADAEAPLEAPGSVERQG